MPIRKYSFCELSGDSYVRKLDLFEGESISLNCMPGLLVNSLNKYCAGLKNITLKEEGIPTDQIEHDRFWHTSKMEESIWAAYFTD
jgi:hypothetical protein